MELAEPYVKWASEPLRPEDVPPAIERAWHIAMQGPHGPTFVSVPMDDWDQEALPLVPRDVAHRTGPDLEIDSAVQGLYGLPEETGRRG